MIEKLTEEEKNIILQAKQESSQIENNYSGELKDLYQKKEELIKHYRGFFMDQITIFVRKLAQDSKEDLSDHKMYHMLIGSSTEKGEKIYSDFSQEEIDSNSKIKKFVEIDLEMKKFIEDEYQKMLEEKNNSIS